jgi:hypothetical protein
VPIAIAAALPIRSYPRLFSPSVPCLVALLAVGAWTAWRSRWARAVGVALAAVWVVLLAPGVADVYRRDIEGWKPVCAAVAGSEPDATVLVNEPFMAAPFRACYAGPLTVQPFPRRRARVDATSIKALAGGKRVVWVIYSHAWRTDPRRRGAAALVSAGYRLDRFMQTPGIDLYRFVRAGEGQNMATSPPA